MKKLIVLLCSITVLLSSIGCISVTRTETRTQRTSGYDPQYRKLIENWCNQNEASQQMTHKDCMRFWGIDE